MTRTETIDFHGQTVEDAVADFEQRLWSLDVSVNGRVFKLITGHGAIQAAIITFLDENKIEWKYKFGNKGCLIVEVEP